MDFEFVSPRSASKLCMCVRSLHAKGAVWSQSVGGCLDIPGIITSWGISLFLPKTKAMRHPK